MIFFTVNLGVQLVYNQFAAIFSVTDYMRQKTAENEGDKITQQMIAFITVNIFAVQERFDFKKCRFFLAFRRKTNFENSTKFDPVRGNKPCILT